MTGEYLADACALIVFPAYEQPDRLMPNAATLMREAEILVSPITVWEITRKVSIGKLPPVWMDGQTFSQLLHAQGFRLHPLSWDEAEASNALPSLHRDPMDRMLIATALRNGLTIITDDRQCAAYGVRTVW
ncbi:MAG TPA: type II toxin-antitoxin system VapC family toxin [Acetobacteraceae bacterium]|nr:type II toxin-antitoxin system VapC family toxin [Acetobacteraceae bacterium]